MSALTALTDATLFTGEAFVEGHALIIGGGRIIDIAQSRKIPADAERVSYPGRILAPGFIDVQVNGGGNLLFNNTPTAATCLGIAAAHRRFGTTRILPTVISDTPDIIGKAIAATRAARRKDKGILGIHIEGPHLGQARRGVHKAERLRLLTDDDMRLYRREGDEIMLMTVAPECVTPDQIKQLRAQGVIVSLGHTAATAAQTRAALAAGATGFTHLFNGMGGLSAREQGPADVALDDRASWCGLIADGHHVLPEMIRLALRAKPGRIFLVSDAMPPAASEHPEPFQLYGETIRVEDGRCVNREGKLAGAAITLSDAVRNCGVKFGIAPEEALRMASTYPAAFLGLDKSLGMLLPGYEADIAVLHVQGVDFVPEAPLVSSGS
jgi:N-acetylglucosamine-6-phosphate deacetylase